MFKFFSIIAFISSSILKELLTEVNINKKYFYKLSFNSLPFTLN